MKSLLKILLSLAAFVVGLYFGFQWINQFIHWLTASIENHDLRIVLMAIIWFFCFGLIVRFCWLVGSILASLVKLLLSVL
jgi:uncharacterized membrane protein required for colicin V production